MKYVHVTEQLYIARIFDFFYLFSPFQRLQHCLLLGDPLWRLFWIVIDCYTMAFCKYVLGCHLVYIGALIYTLGQMAYFVTLVALRYLVMTLAIRILVMTLPWQMSCTTTSTTGSFLYCFLLAGAKLCTHITSIGCIYFLMNYPHV